jgi:hypothetical protein
LNFTTKKTALAAILALILLAGASCRTAKTLPPADLSSPGWHLLQGQAVWKPTKNRPELAGDLLLATNDNGNYLIQFTKTPFTVATVRVENGQWQIQFGDGHRAWSGRGAPPSGRFAWFQITRSLGQTGPQPPWKFTRRPDDSWGLANPRTGETLEGVFFQ